MQGSAPYSDVPVERMLPDVRTMLMSLRVAELQLCAARLGLTRSGRKSDLQNRVLGYLADSGALNTAGPPQSSAALARLATAQRIVREVYCAASGLKIGPPPQGLDSLVGPGPSSPLQQGGAQTVQSPSKLISLGQRRVRCLCLNDAFRRDMLQCREPTCKVWQHAECLNTLDRNAPFYCENCRAHFSDPFWEPVELLLPPIRLETVRSHALVRDQYGEQHPVQRAERAVYLSDKQLEREKEDPQGARVQIECILLEDKVPFRYHWPRNVTLRINTREYRPYGRSATAKMGINQRDEAANITSLCFRGRNSIEISAVEAGRWILLLHRARRRSLDQVKSMMAAIETLEAAVKRVQSQIAGSHGDDEGSIAVASVVISLRDPMSGQRMSIPARFTDASSFQPFDLDSFLSLAQSNRKWQDPMTLKNSTIRELQVDLYVQKVLDALKGHPHIETIEINDQGLWRPEGSTGPWWAIDQSVDDLFVSLGPLLKKGAELSEKMNGGGVSNGPTGTDDSGVVISDNDSETDEEEELRQAAEAVRPAAAALAGEKRKALEEPEVIDLISSDDEAQPAQGKDSKKQMLRVSNSVDQTSRNEGPGPMSVFARLAADAVEGMPNSNASACGNNNGNGVPAMAAWPHQPVLVPLSLRPPAPQTLRQQGPVAPPANFVPIHPWLGTTRVPPQVVIAANQPMPPTWNFAPPPLGQGTNIPEGSSGLPVGPSISTQVLAKNGGGASPAVPESQNGVNPQIQAGEHRLSQEEVADLLQTEAYLAANPDVLDDVAVQATVSGWLN